MFFLLSCRGTFYQIINGKLYRQKECMFPSRCAGIEHFLLLIINDLPDMEFVINTRDYPQSSKYFNEPLPIFSFSKVNPPIELYKQDPIYKLCIYKLIIQFSTSDSRLQWHNISCVEFLGRGSSDIVISPRFGSLGFT